MHSTRLAHEFNLRCSLGLNLSNGVPEGLPADGQLEGGRAPQAPSQYLMQLRVTNIAYERR